MKILNQEKMKSRIILILLLMCGISVLSQADRLDSLLDEVLGKDLEMMTYPDSFSTFMFLYGGVNYDSKTFYAGREIGDDMYSMNGYMYFFHSKGFYIGTSGLWYSQFDPGYSATIATAGFYKSLVKIKNLSIRASYSRYFYYQPDPEFEYSYTNSLNAGLSLKYRWIGGRISSGFLFGKDVGMNVKPVLFSQITLARFGTYDNIQIEPELSFLIASEAVEYETAGNPDSNLSDSQTKTATENKYGLLNTQFYLPVCLFFRDFDLELGYTVNFPVSQDQSITYPVSSFFSVSFGYVLSLN